jgi:hypothetical protein
MNQFFLKKTQQSTYHINSRHIIIDEVIKILLKKLFLLQILQQFNLRKLYCFIKYNKKYVHNKYTT